MRLKRDSKPAEASVVEVPVTLEAAEEQLARIFQHSLFASTPALRLFLQFTVRKTLQGLSHEIKEYTIGAEMLGRGPSFDARDSSIVRTQAFNMRSRLKAYYEEQGATVPFQIKYKPGSYVPIFIAPGSVAPASAPATPGNVIRLAVEPPNFDHVPAELHAPFQQLYQALLVELIQAGHIRVAAPSRHAASPSESVDFQVALRVDSSQQRLKLVAQMTDLRDQGYLVWARPFEWPGNAFEPERAATQVATQVERALHKFTNLQPRAAQTNPPAAQAAYAEGHTYLTRMNAADCRRAQRRFLDAMDLAPAWAAAHSGFALSVAQGVLLQDSASLALIVDAEVAAARSLALDKNAQQSQLARGVALALFQWDAPAAAKYLARAEGLQDSLSPDPLTASMLALVDWIPQQRFAEAIERLHPIVRTFPSNMLVRFALGTALRLARRYPEALQLFSTSLELDDRCSVAAIAMAQVFAHQDSPGQALAALHKAESLTGRVAPIVALEGYLSGTAGQFERAAELEAELETLAPPETNFFFERSLIRLGAAGRDEAMPLLERALHMKEPAAFLGHLEPLLETIRNSPSGQQVFMVA